jgi:WD40 repeat protein
VDRLCDALFLSHRAQERDDNLIFVRERLLRSEADLAALLELYGRVREGKPVPDDDTNPLVSLLRLSGIARVRRGLLRVRNRIYGRVFDREWVTLHMPDAELRRQKAAFRRGVARTSAIASVVLAVVAGLAFATWTSGRRARSALAGEAQERRNARRALYVSDMNLAQQALQDGDLFRLRKLLEAHGPGPDGEELRGFEWRYLWHAYYHRLFLPRVGTLGAQVRSVAFSPDRPLVAIGRDDGSVEFCDAASRRSLQTVPAAHGSPVDGVAFSRDGRLLATGSEDGAVKLWNMARQEAVKILRAPPADSLPIAFSPDGALLAAGSGNSVILWNAAGDRKIALLKGPTGGAITCLAFTPRGRLLATGHGGGALRLWDAAARRLLRRLPGHEQGDVYSVAFDPDGKTLASTGYDQTVRLWDVATGRPLATLRGHRAIGRAVTFSPDGRTLATGSQDGTVRLYDAVTHRFRESVPGQAPVWSLAFSGDGGSLVIGSWEGARLLDLTRPPEGGVFQSGEPIAYALAFSPDGKTLARGTWGGSIELWDVATGSMRVIPGRRGTVWSLAYSTDGKTLAAGCGFYARSDLPGYVTFWDARTGKPAPELRVDEGGVCTVAFSPDGRYLLIGVSFKALKLWDLPARAWEESFTGPKPWQYIFGFLSPDGRTIATGVWNWDTVELRPFATRGPGRFPTVRQQLIDGAALSPDGKLLATGGDDRTVMLWDSRSGQRIARLEGHVGVTGPLAFSPDSRTLASASEDHTVKLWSTTILQEVGTFHEQELPVRAVAFSPNGTILASTADDGKVRLRRAAPFSETDARSP